MKFLIFKHQKGGVWGGGIFEVLLVGYVIDFFRGKVAILHYSSDEKQCFQVRQIFFR
jgi:hypothetical protein